MKSQLGGDPLEGYPEFGAWFLADNEDVNEGNGEGNQNNLFEHNLFYDTDEELPPPFLDQQHRIHDQYLDAFQLADNIRQHVQEENAQHAGMSKRTSYSKIYHPDVRARPHLSHKRIFTCGRVFTIRADDKKCICTSAGPRAYAWTRIGHTSRGRGYRGGSWGFFYIRGNSPPFPSLPTNPG
jgi:hypothetical protein